MFHYNFGWKYGFERATQKMTQLIFGTSFDHVLVALNLLDSMVETADDIFDLFEIKTCKVRRNVSKIL